MAIALTSSFALLLAIVAFLLYLAVFIPDGWSFGAGVLMIVLPGAWTLSQQRRRWDPGRAPEDARRRLSRVAERLAVVADHPVPRTSVVGYEVPLSWTVAPVRRPPTIHATTGLLDRLEDRELEAVVAHELAHVLHRDAVVITLLARPPAAFFEGLAGTRRMDPFRGWMATIAFSLVFGLPALVLALLARSVSRHRELAADRTAALLTGSPAAVAAALVAVDDALERQRGRDLRHAARRDAFHFVPVRVRHGLGRLWATHPPLRRRIERMERLEADLQR